MFTKKYQNKKTAQKIAYTKHGYILLMVTNAGHRIPRLKIFKKKWIKTEEYVSEFTEFPCTYTLEEISLHQHRLLFFSSSLWL